MKPKASLLVSPFSLFQEPIVCHYTNAQSSLSTTGYVRSAWLHDFSCINVGAGGQRAAFVHPIKNLRGHRCIFPCFGAKNIARLVYKTGSTA